MRTPKIRHMRQRTFGRLRNSKRIQKFIDYSNERTGLTNSQVFDSMKVPGSAQDVANLPNQER